MMKDKSTGDAPASSHSMLAEDEKAQKRFQEHEKEPEPVPEPKPVSKYINPLTDFGFKYIFGDKEFLIHFLNASLRLKDKIVDLTYDNPEKQGRAEDDRKTIFDLYCTLETGELIMIEMQHYRQTFFKDRVVYYASRLIQEQGESKKGKNEEGDDWNFELKPVYSVNIVAFPLDGEAARKTRESDKFATYVQLYDIELRRVFYSKLTMVFLELPFFTKEESALASDLDNWMYILKHLQKLENVPEPFHNKVFERLFAKAEIAKMSKKDRKEYDDSLKNYRDMNALLRDMNALLYDIAKVRKEADESKKEADESKKTVAERDKTVAERDKTIAENKRTIEILQKSLAGYYQKFGKINGET